MNKNFESKKKTMKTTKGIFLIIIKRYDLEWIDRSEFICKS